MKNKLYRWLVGVAFALSVFALSGAAEAYCRWIPTHWVNGYRVQGHQVCGSGGYYYRHGYGYTQCRWIPGHWRNGFWREGHRVCWRVY